MSALGQYVKRHRGALLGGIGSAAAVALTLDPATGVAGTSVRFAMWFAVSATVIAVAMTAGIAVAEAHAAKPQVPRAVARRPRRDAEMYN
jgi:hypothetical protein